MLERRRATKWVSPTHLVVAALIAMTVSSSALAQKEQVLTNADVIAMSKADLGDDVITAKIQQALIEKLDVSTDSLIALKNAGVTKAVITAMVKRVDQRNGAKAQAGSNSTGGAAQSANPARPVSLRVNGSTIVIEPVVAVQRNERGFFVTMVFLDFPGTSATTKVSGRNVTALIQSDLNPSAQFWIVKLEVLKDEEVRTLKFGSLKGVIAPDEDWTVSATVEKSSEGVWAMTSKKDLEPGEYGVFKMGPYNTTGTDLLFGFTVN